MPPEADPKAAPPAPSASPAPPASPPPDRPSGDPAVFDAMLKRSEDNAKKDLAERDAKIKEGDAARKELEDRLAIYAKREAEETEATYNALPEPQRKLADVVKGVMPAEKYREYLGLLGAAVPKADDEGGGVSVGPPPRLQRGSDEGVDSKTGRGGRYKVKHADMMRDRLGIEEPKHLPNAIVEHDRSGTRVMIPLHGFRRLLQIVKGVPLTPEEAAKRR